MSKYSITLNFFIPEELITILKKLKFTEEIKYDWRKTGYAHCIIKALEIRNSEPSKKDILTWVKATNEVLSKNGYFRVLLEGIHNFPRIIYAAVKSEDLIHIHNNLCKALPSSQSQFEGKNYLPHVSLIESISEVKQKYSSNTKIGNLVVKEIQLISWDLENNNEPKILHCFKL